ncbi:MAG: chemotaxis protein, partial [Candidatus Competibacteraceae bacterium]
QQNAALVEQTAAASHSMGDQAQELQQLMAFFKLDGQEPITKATVAALAVDAAHPKVASKAPAGSRRQ